MANPPRSPTRHPRVRAVGATIQLLKHAPTEAIAPVLLQSQRVSKEKPDPRDGIGLIVCTENPIRVDDVWNRLSWRNDRAALFRSGRPGLTIQVEVAA
jgi:hypothetical protein